LSLSVREPEVARTRDRARRMNSPGDGLLNGVHVLIVEDDPDARYFLSAALTVAGALVTAVAAAARCQPSPCYRPARARPLRGPPAFITASRARWTSSISEPWSGSCPDVSRATGWVVRLAGVGPAALGFGGAGGPLRFHETP
jgi:hypothetical protein